MSNLYKFKKSKEKSSRNKIIYDQRVHQRKTLRAIGEKHNLSRERVRQIVQSQKNRYEELPKIPKLMQDLPLNTRLSLFLRRAKQTKTPIKKFISSWDIPTLLEWPSLGPTSVCLLYKILEEGGFDVQNLWTPRNRKNHDTFEHRGLRFRVRDFSQ